MKLLIIESKGKIEKLKSILGNDWEIAASFGHVCDLPEKEMGVEAPNFAPQYVLTERGEGVVGRLEAMCKRASQVFIGTDPDREGEAIGWHLARLLKLQNAQRVAFNEITAPVVTKAVANPRKIDNRLVAAQEARRVLDRLVGYMVSPVLSNRAGLRLSAGRVQTPAIVLLVERERAILGFKPTDHFDVRLIFSREKISWSAMWDTSPHISDETPYVLDAQFAQQVANLRTVTVEAFEESTRKRKPLPPFSTAAFQQAASVRLGMNPDDAMKAAQRLYEAGHISYHRTDNPNISEEAWPLVQAELVKSGIEAAPTWRQFKAPDGAQVGHPAITPTHWEVKSVAEDNEVYQLIRVRALASQAADAVYSVRSAILSSELDGNKIRFRAVGETETNKGWRALLEQDDTKEADEQDAQTINAVPLLQVGERLEADSGEVVKLRTRAPKRFTKASLIAKLESEGIGRPATYAAIMANIETRNYIEEKKRLIYPTENAFYIVDQLREIFSFANVQFTRIVEKELDLVADGTISYSQVIQKSHSKLVNEIEALNQSGAAPRFACPSCGKAMRVLKGKSGDFWGCSGYPECKETRPDDKGKPSEKQQDSESEFKCPSCQKPLARRKSKNYDFWGCTGYKDGCKQSFENKRGKPDFAGAKKGDKK